jgi:hypothetical protein
MSAFATPAGNSTQLLPATHVLGRTIAMVRFFGFIGESRPPAVTEPASGTSSHEWGDA